MIARFAPFIFALFIWHGTNAQYLVRIRDINKKPPIDTCELRITYLIQFPMDTTKWKESFDLFNLDVGRRYTKYYSASAERKDSLMHDPTGPAFNKRDHFPDNYFIQYQDIYWNNDDAASCTVWTRFNWTEYVYDDRITDLKWNVDGISHMKILGYDCARATTTFRGRSYTVWFTPEIPLQFGPWKFSGLPGAILHAEDDSKLFIWQTQSISQPQNIPITTYNDKLHTVRCKRRDVMKMQRMAWEDPAGLAIFTGTPLSYIEDGKVKNFQSGAFRYPYRPFPECD